MRFFWLRFLEIKQLKLKKIMLRLFCRPELWQLNVDKYSEKNLILSRTMVRLILGLKFL